MIRSNLILPFIIFYLLSLSGCQENKNNEEEQQIKNLQEQISKLQVQILILQGDVFTLKKGYETVVLDLSSKSYQRIDTSTGIFLILPKDIQPYAGGYKIILSIGNPSSATYIGFTLKVKWNKSVNPNPDFRLEEWKKSLQEKEFSFPDTLNPGSWNDVELIISPATKKHYFFGRLGRVGSKILY